MTAADDAGEVPQVERLPQEIADHPDPCACPRCRGFERCYACGRIKLDIDWCWAERRLVL